MINDTVKSGGGSPPQGCTLCPVKCGAIRSERAGACGADDNVKIAKFYLHKGEEPVISGTNGSGTVFFCGCSLRCVFCQNYELSRSLRGKTFTVKELAEIFKKLESDGAHNINLVTATQYADKVIEALKIYFPAVPILYNTHGYERIETLKTLNDFVSVYLPDLKFYSPAVSARYTGKNNYFEIASRAIEYMANKPIAFGEDGLMKSGTIVRHLVLPQNVPDSLSVLDFLSDFKDKIYLSVMSQYTPYGDIKNLPELNRKITKREYNKVVDYAVSLGFTNMFFQDEKSASEEYIPRWDF